MSSSVSLTRTKCTIGSPPAAGLSVTRGGNHSESAFLTAVYLLKVDRRVQTVGNHAAAWLGAAIGDAALNDRTAAIRSRANSTSGS